MNPQTIINNLTQELVSALSNIKTFPEGLLPHTIFVEEEGVNNNNEGVPVYNPYKLTQIFSDGTCVLLNETTKLTEQRYLKEINIDWLTTVWNRYAELSGSEKEFGNQKEKKVIIYSIERFNRDTTSKTLLKYLSKDEHPYAEIMSVEEFVRRVDYEEHNDLEYFARVIEC